MTIWDPEGAQRAIYEEAGFDPREPADPYDLAEALMGRGCLECLPRIAGGAPGFYSPHGAHERIYLWKGLADFRERWTIFHELSERHYYPHKGDEGHEVACDQLAARLRAPREAFRQLVSIVGRRLKPLAEQSGQSQTSTMMRFGETFGDPVVVVTPDHVHYRGEEWGWPPVDELRRLTRARKLPPEVRRVKLDDARARYAFLGVAA